MNPSDQHRPQRPGQNSDPRSADQGPPGQTRGEPNVNETLCEADAAALEALLAAGLEPQHAAGAEAQRVDRCARLLGQLELPSGSLGDPLLIDATIVRVMLARIDAGTLTPREEDALEALVAAEFDPERCTGAVRTRAAAIAGRLRSLDMPISSISRDTLVSATLSRVQASIDSQERRLNVEERRLVGRPRARLTDLISVAALLLIAGAVITPLVGAVRGHSQRLACQGGMAAAGLGFGLYAGDNREALPMATASRAGTPWWFVGDPSRSNSANLYTLVRTGNVRAVGLACPGNATACRSDLPPGAADWSSIDQVSYSYQNLFSSERPRWSGPTITVVMADRSPVVPKAIRGETINPLSNSLNHGGVGQGILRNDGSYAWLRTPVTTEGDNIWLPRQLEELFARLKDPTRADPLKGTEVPTTADDVFVSP